jgi:phosphoserine phosphatase
MVKRKPFAIADKEGTFNQTIAVVMWRWFTDVESSRFRNRFHAKPTVKEKAESSISSLGLDGVLYY